MSPNEREAAAGIEVRRMRLPVEVPCSEPEALTATWEAGPPPDEKDVDHRRGTLARVPVLAPVKELR